MQCGPKCEINISEQSRYQYKNSQISHVVCPVAAKYCVYNWCHPRILKSRISFFNQLTPRRLNQGDSVQGDSILQYEWLHRCWWRMLETKCVGDNYKMLVTVLAILVTNIHYLFRLASGTNIPKMPPTSTFSHQHPQIVTNFRWLTSRFHQHHCHRMN